MKLVMKSYPMNMLKGEQSTRRKELMLDGYLFKGNSEHLRSVLLRCQMAMKINIVVVWVERSLVMVIEWKFSSQLSHSFS